MSLDDCRAREELNVAVVGATGLVGRELIALLAERSWPIATLSTFARVQSHVSISGETYAVQPLDLQRLRGHDVVFLAGTGELARRVVPSCGSDQLVIDNSSAFRMDPSVPLVIPEVNESDIGKCFVGRIDGFCRVGCFSDDVHLFGGLQQEAQLVACEGFVIHNDRCDFSFGVHCSV